MSHIRHGFIDVGTLLAYLIASELIPALFTQLWRNYIFQMKTLTSINVTLLFESLKAIHICTRISNQWGR